MSKVTVRNLRKHFDNDAIVYVGISPKDAVVSAYAQSKNDFKTWDYEMNYGHLVAEGNNTITCGDFAVWK